MRLRRGACPSKNLPVGRCDTKQNEASKQQQQNRQKRLRERANKQALLQDRLNAANALIQLANPEPCINNEQTIPAKFSTDAQEVLCVQATDEKGVQYV